MGAGGSKPTDIRCECFCVYVYVCGDRWRGGRSQTGWTLSIQWAHTNLHNPENDRIEIPPPKNRSQESLRVLERCSEAGRVELRQMVERMQRMKEDYVRHRKVCNKRD